MCRGGTIPRFLIFLGRSSNPSQESFSMVVSVPASHGKNLVVRQLGLSSNPGRGVLVKCPNAQH